MNKDKVFVNLSIIFVISLIVLIALIGFGISFTDIKSLKESNHQLRATVIKQQQEITVLKDSIQILNKKR
jgi:cell division protein FtsB